MFLCGSCGKLLVSMLGQGGLRTCATCFVPIWRLIHFVQLAGMRAASWYSLNTCLWVGRAWQMPRVVPGRRPCKFPRVAFWGGRQVLIAWVCLREHCSVAVLLAPPAEAAGVWVPLQH